MSVYDLVVIGSGTGGYVAAIRAAQLGMRTAVVERDPIVGGTCLNLGCIPTKALLEHAHAFKLAQQAAEWGIHFGADRREPTLDLGRVHERKNAIVTSLTKGVEFLFKKHKIDRLHGTGRLAGGGQVSVTAAGASDTTTLIGTEIVVATGSAPRSVPGIAIDRTHIVTSDDAIHLPEIPASIAILGAGAVGVEFASIFRQFGSDVVLIELQSRLVPGEDAAVSAELEKQFKKRGIVVRTGAEVRRAVRTAAGVSIELTDGPSIEVAKLLVATGRGPMTDGLGAVEAGLALDRGFVVVDDLYRTSVPGISAIGDVITMTGRSHPQLAHLSSAEGILVAERLAGRDVPVLNYDHVPSCTYCDPEIGSVGLTEAAAAERGFDVRVGTFPFSALGRARISGDTAGFVKIVAEAEYDQLLGVHIIGARATELIAEAVIALRLESTAEELMRAIHAHPTMAEAIGEAAHALHGGAIHI